MKILQINSHYNQGGAAKMVACIHKQLLAEGEESYVVYGRGQQPKEENVYRIDNDAEVYFSALMSRLLGLNGWGNWIATGRLIKLIRQIQPDVIHMHALHGYYLNFGRLFKYLKNAGIPCVWTMHDCHAFVGNCGYFFECRKWENGCQHCQNIRNYPTSQFFDLTRYMWKKKREWFTWCERMVITTPSHWMTAEVRKSFLGKYTCRTMRNGIDTEGTFYPRNREQCRRKYGFAETDKLVLGIAVDYDDPRKGVKFIIQAAKDMADEAKFILVGWSKANTDVLSDIQNIIAIPATSDTEALAEYYSMADAFVLPSLAENYATVSLESMACGTPVVGFDAGGIPEQLLENKGIVVPTGNQKAFTAAVREAISSENKLLRGEPLVEMIRNKNSTDKTVREYLTLYHELAQK